MDHNNQQNHQKNNATSPGGKKTLFGRRPLYIKKTSLKRIKNLTNEKQQQQQQRESSSCNSPKVLFSPSSCSTTTSTTTTTTATTLSTFGFVGNTVLPSNRDCSHSATSVKSNRSSNRSSAVSPFPKQSIMNGGKGKASEVCPW